MTSANPHLLLRECCYGHPAFQTRQLRPGESDPFPRVASRARIQIQHSGLGARALNPTLCHGTRGGLGGGCSSNSIILCEMKANVQVWPLQEGNVPRSSALFLSQLCCFPSPLLYRGCCFRRRSCVVQEGKERLEVRCLHPSPAFLPCRLGKEQVGTILPATPQLPEPASKRAQGEAEKGGGGVAILRLPGFWVLSLPRLSQSDVPLACRNSAGFTEIRSL